MFIYGSFIIYASSSIKHISISGLIEARKEEIFELNKRFDGEHCLFESQRSIRGRYACIPLLRL